MEFRREKYFPGSGPKGYIDHVGLFFAFAISLLLAFFGIFFFIAIFAGIFFVGLAIGVLFGLRSGGPASGAFEYEAAGAVDGDFVGVQVNGFARGVLLRFRSVRRTSNSFRIRSQT